jgi:hypothetical protein
MQPIDVKVDPTTGLVVVVYPLRRARGSRTWSQKAPRTLSKAIRQGIGARYLYRGGR